MAIDESHRIMAAAIYEIRLLLANYLGSDCDADPDVRLAAHLSYALHNDASAIMNGNSCVDINEMKSRIRNAQEIPARIYSNGGRHLGIADPDTENPE